MRAMVFDAPGRPLREADVPTPSPQPTQVLIKVHACGVCRTDLHIIDGDLPATKRPLIPGHEIVGTVVKKGSRVGNAFEVGQRVGVPWLGYTDGACRYCQTGRENLCDHPQFTGYTIDGGYAEYTVADHRYCFPLPEQYSDAEIAPMLCAGLIGYRSLTLAGDAPACISHHPSTAAADPLALAGRTPSSRLDVVSATPAPSSGPCAPPDRRLDALATNSGEKFRLGLYGFGASAHIIVQLARYTGRAVYAFTRPGDDERQRFARELGAVWAGGSDSMPPEELDAAIIFAPVGALVPTALRAVAKGGVVVCAGIHMSDIPSFPYRVLWEERMIRSVANLTRRDGEEFLKLAPQAGVHTSVTTYPLAKANEAIADVREGRLDGAAVLLMD